MLVSTYEEIIEDLPREVRRIAEHLQLNLSPIQCEKIAANYSIKRQQKRVEKFRDELKKIPRDPNDRQELADYYDEETLLHINHINLGKIGRGKEDLSRLELERIEQKVKNWCRDNHYPATTFLPMDNG